MSTPLTPGFELDERLAGLSPEKRALLARMLATRASGRAGDAIPRRSDPSAPAPLSRAQELLWVHQQMDPRSSAYNVALVRRVRGPLDLESIRRALAVVTDRHEALRTRFVEVGGEPRQVVMPQAEAECEVHDLRASPAEQREAEARAIVGQVARTPFDLASGAGPRAVLVRVDDEEAVLVLVVHHLVCDGASAAIVLAELSAAYASEIDGRPAVLAPVSLQLADHAAWERTASEPAAVERALAFWREYLRDAPGMVELPTDRPRTPEADATAGRVTRVFDVGLRDGVRALARASAATPFMVLLAAFQVLLHRHAGQDDVVVGTPVAGRSRPELQGMVGHLADTLALRARFADDPTFADLLARVRAGCVQAFSHEEVGLERVAQELRHQGLATAAFNVAFVLQDASIVTRQFGGAVLEPLQRDGGENAKFELTLSMSEREQGLYASLEYRTALWERESAERMLARLEVLLTNAVRSPDTRVSRLMLLPGAERTQVLELFNATDRPYPRDALVHELFAAQAAAHPDAIAVECGDRSLSYGALDESSRLLAAQLAASGVRPGDRVALCAERSLSGVIATLAILRAGAAYVPLEPSYPAERLGFMLADSGAAVLLLERAVREAVADLRLQAALPVPPPVLVIEDALAAAAASPPAATELHRSDAGATPAYVMYTSGSTGQPKGVVVPHRAIVRLVCDTDYAPLGPDTVMLGFAPSAFDAATFEVWGALLNGGRLVLVPSGLPDLAMLGRIVREHGVTTLWLTAALYQQVVESGLADYAGVRTLLAGGDVLSPTHVARTMTMLPTVQLVNGYGPTENTTFTCCFPVPHPWSPDRAVPIGRPIANTRVYILDPQGAPAPIGVPGELHAAGDGLALGYLNRPELTTERFVAHPELGRLYRTGDRARWRTDGVIEFLGRLDLQVKIRGFRVEPGEVEAVLAGHPGVREAAVVPTEGGGTPGGERQLSGYYAVRPGFEQVLTPAALRRYLGERLPAYMIPAALIELDALPVGPTGKLDRQALPAPEPGEVQHVEQLSPRDDVERIVADAFAEALGRQPASVEASFFDLGGHSLLAMRVVARVAKVFRTQLPLRRFFDAPTVAGIACAVREAEAKPGQAAAIAAMLLRIQNMSPEERERLRARATSPDRTTG